MAIFFTKCVSLFANNYQFLCYVLKQSLSVLELIRAHWDILNIYIEFVGLSSSSQLMAQLFIILEWPLDPFLVREGDRKLNFIPLKHLFFTYDLHVPPVSF